MKHSHLNVNMLQNSIFALWKLVEMQTTPETVLFYSSWEQVYIGPSGLIISQQKYDSYQAF